MLPSHECDSTWLQLPVTLSVRDRRPTRESPFDPKTPPGTQDRSLVSDPQKQ